MSPSSSACDALVARLAELTASAMGPVVSELTPSELEGLEAEVRARLDALPIPVGLRAAGPWLRRRHRLEQILGWCACLRGDPRALVEAARQEWLQGGDHAAYLDVLAAHGDREHAVRMALAILEQRGVAESGAESAAARAIGIPNGFRLALDALAACPTADAWQALLRFTPKDRLDERSRFALRILLRRGLAPSLVFELLGATASEQAAIELAESGEVEAACIARVARPLEPMTRARLLGLAARAAASHGEGFAAVRYLRESRAAAPARSSEDDVAYVRAQGGPGIDSLLASAGFDGTPARPFD